MADQEDLISENDPLDGQRLVYQVPANDQVTVRKDILYKTIENTRLKLDIYYPPDYDKSSRYPAVLFIHGDAPPEHLIHSKDGGQYRDWGRLVATTGLIAITANHRSTEGLHNVVGVANDIDDLLSFVREHHASLHIDPERLGIWTCSSGGPFALRAALLEAPTYIRALVCYYSFTELRTYYTALYSTTGEVIGPVPTFDEDDFAEFSATDLLLRRTSTTAPLFIARAGLDYAELNEALDVFISEALTQNVALTLMNHPTGQHAFDLLDADDRSREIIQATLAFLHAHLLE